MAADAMRTVSNRNLAAHKTRLILTVLAVLLGTAFVAGSFVFTDTLQQTFHRITDNADKGVSAQVQTRTSYDPGVPLSLLPKIRAVGGVAVVEPNIDEPLALVNAKGDKVQPGGAPSVGGIWLSAADSVTTPPKLKSGHAPSAAGEVAINNGAAKKGHIHTGDRVKVVLPQTGVIQVTVSGIYRTSVDTGGYIGVLFTQQQGLQLLTDGQHVASVDVSARDGVSEKTLTKRIAAILPSDLQAKTGNQVRTDDRNAVAAALSFVNILLLAFGLIALLVGTFIIYNTFSMIVAQRLRELALLRAVGASRRQVGRMVRREAAIIGLIGSVLGVAAGVGLAYLLRVLLDALGLGLPSGPLVISIRTVVVGLILGVGVTLLSANAPARRAGRVPPVAALRAEFASESQSSLRRRTMIGTVLFALGVVASIAGVLSSSSGTAASLIGLGLLGAGAGVLMLSPLLAGWVISPLGRVIGRPFGAIGALARTNAVRNPRRTAGTAFALTVGLLLVAAIAVIGASTKASLNKVFDTSVKSDLVLSTSLEINVPQPVAQQVRQAPGVAAVTEVHSLSAKINDHHQIGTAIDGPFASALSVKFTSGGGAPTNGKILISKSTASERHLRVGSPVSLSVPGKGSVNLQVSGIYQDNQLAGPWMTSGDVYRQLTPQNQWSDQAVLVRKDSGVSTSTLKQTLERITNPYYVVNVQTRSEFKGSVASQVNGLLGLLYGLLGLAIIIAILGIINTLALSVVERRREIGMLRAIGMQRKQVRRTIYLESLLISVFGALLGLVLGVAFGAMFTKTLHGQGLDQLSIPWAQAVEFLVLAAVVGVLAALWPGARAARTRPLEAITAE